MCGKRGKNADLYCLFLLRFGGPGPRTMVSLVAWYSLLSLLPVGATSSGGCESAADCSMAGSCVSGSCLCEPGWKGSNCHLLALGESYRCGSGGLCMHGELNGVTATWGGEAVADDDGNWHIYAAGFPNGTLSVWLNDSVVVHAQASAPEGPYNPVDVALGPRGARTDTYFDSTTVHNPAVQRAPDGTYLLYYMGSSYNSQQDSSTSGSDTRCATASKRNTTSLCNQRIGLATSKSPNGPWTRRDAPVLGTGPLGAWDDLFVTNPTPHVFSNGSVLLIYKARSIENFGVMSTGAAFAEHWSGPYVRRTPGAPIALPGNCEDAGIYRSPQSGVFRMILHCGCAYKYVWSLDGTNWTVQNETTPWCDIRFSDGTNGTVSRRERPKWLLGADGQPTHLITAVQPVDSVDPEHGKNTFTMTTKLLRGN